MTEPEPRDAERQARIAAAMPAALAEKMRSDRAAGERRPVTVLFADVVGSTALVESMDPEDWTAIVNEAFDAMSTAIYRYEGTIARLMGDAVLAFFGAPVAHEDDPQRAVRAALDMIRAIDSELRPRVQREQGSDFRIRAGINTGEVVVGVVGSDLAYEYTAMGDAVNVASRIHSAAEPGTLLVTAATYRFVMPVVEAVDRGELDVKGKSGPIRLHEIRGLRATPGPARGLAGRQSALVGRDGELTRLEQAFGAVRAGQGRVACVIGDAGLGKSRLLAEFARSARAPADADVIWAQGQCLSYGQGIPYHLVIDLLRSLVGIGATADEAEFADALERRTRDLLGETWADTYAYLAHMSGLPLTPELASRITRVDFEVLKRYVAAVHQLVQAMATARGACAVVLVCEDAHWADASSVDVIYQAMPLANELPLMWLVTSRPERGATGWRLITAARDIFGEALVEVRLSPLSTEYTRQLVANLLEIESLPDEVRDVILAKAEGNPFFVEEVIRMLIDRGAIVERDGRWIATGEIGDVEIPGTLQGLLLARIDRLPPSARRTIRTASVIGRQFPLRVLERLIDAAAKP